MEQHDVMSQIHQFYDLLSPFKSVILVHKELRLRMGGKCNYYKILYLHLHLVLGS